MEWRGEGGGELDWVMADEVSIIHFQRIAKKLNFYPLFKAKLDPKSR